MRDRTSWDFVSVGVCKDSTLETCSVPVGSGRDSLEEGGGTRRGASTPTKKRGLASGGTCLPLQDQLEVTVGALCSVAGYPISSLRRKNSGTGMKALIGE